MIDLDGTLYATNTFHQFVKYLLTRSAKSLDLLLTFRILLFMTFRMLKIISHSRLKYNVLGSIKNKSYLDNVEFVESIGGYKRDISKLYNEEYNLKILATAAPACYSKIIAKDHKFDACIATENPYSRHLLRFENSKENKKKNVVSYLKTKGLGTIDLFITDHIDDLSLIKISKKNIIINPDKHFEKTLQSLDIQYEVVRCD